MPQFTNMQNYTEVTAEVMKYFLHSHKLEQIFELCNIYTHCDVKNSYL